MNTVPVRAFLTLLTAWAGMALATRALGSGQVRPADDRCRKDLISMYEAMAAGRFSTSDHVAHIKIRQWNWVREASGDLRTAPLRQTQLLVETYQSREGFDFRSGEAEYIYLAEARQAYFIAHDLHRVYRMTRAEGDQLSQQMNDLILSSQRVALETAKTVECRQTDGLRTFLVEPDTATSRRTSLERISYQVSPKGALIAQDFFFYPGGTIVRQRLEYLDFNPSFRSKPGFIRDRIVDSKGRLVRRLRGYEFVDKASTLTPQIR